MFTAALFTVATGGNDPSVPSGGMDKQHALDPHNGTVVSLKNAWSSDTQYHMHGLGKHYIKGKKQVPKATYGMSPCIYVSVCSGCHNKVPQAAWSEQQKFIFAQFCRQEVQDQGAGKCGFW